jgi:hypothetical protein
MLNRGFVSLLVLCILAAVAVAQVSTSRLVGMVQDSTGAAVTNAQVTATNEATGMSFRTVSSSSGTYAFEALQPGNYTVAVEASAFRKFTSKGNAVTIGQPATVNVALEVGALTQSVEVTASAENVQTSTSGNFGNVLTQREIADLPIVGTRGRNPLGLIDLQPGVIDTPSITGGAVIVFGVRDRAWNYTLDGIDINETSAPGSNFSPVRTNPDSLSEFRVITSNATAEYGQTSGGQVSMVTRSGSNEFHGGLFEFYRTPRFNANEWQYNFNGLGKRQFVQHVYGGDVGGPIWKNHTFFFVNQQFLRTHETASITQTVYTASARQGMLRFVPGGRNGNAGAATPSVDRSGNVLPGVSIATYDVAANDPQRIGLDPKIAGYIKGEPLPNRFDVGDGLNTAGFNFTALQYERQHDTTFKIDHIIDSKNAVYARVYLGEQDTNCDRVNGGNEIFPGTGCWVNTMRSPRNLAFNWRWNPTSRFTNEVVVGNNKFTFNFYQPHGDLNGIAAGWYSPVTIVADPSIANLRTLKTWQVVDNAAYQFGAHALKFGTSLRFTSHNDIRGSIAGLNSVEVVDFAADFDTVAFKIPSTLNQTFDLPTFQGNINFLLGRIGSITRGLVANGDQFVPGVLNFNAHYNGYDFYAQDTWKLRRNLTLDIGLRLQMDPSPTADNNLLSVPNAPMVAGAPATNTLTWVKGKSMYPDRMHNFGPSVGIAWDPFATGKTSLRANYRLAFDRINTFVLSSVIYPNLPGLTYPIVDTSYGQGGGRFSNVPLLSSAPAKPSDLAQPQPYSGASIFAVDPNLKVPTTHEWQFDIQREVLRGTVVQLSYIGRRAYHLFGSYNANQVNYFNFPGMADAFATVKAGGQSALLNSLFSADSRIRPGETASDFFRRNYASALSLNSFSNILQTEATRIQGSGAMAKSVLALSGQNPFLLLPFPQFLGGANVIDSNDFSTYNGAVVQVNQRFSNGVTAGFSYTYSKALSTRSYDPTFTRYTSANSQSAGSTPYDIYNRKLNYGPAEYDHRNVFQGHWTADLPFGNGKRFLHSANGLLDRIVGGFEIAGFFNYYTGRPLTVYSGAYTFNSVVQSFMNCNGCSHDLGHLTEYNGVPYLFTPDQVSKFSAPAPGQLGNTGKGYFWGPPFFDMDMSLLKHIRVTERKNFELRMDATNITNTVSFGLPTATFTSSTFGRIADNVESASRKIQLGAKLNF